jgi:hypothetical protein
MPAESETVVAIGWDMKQITLQTQARRVVSDAERGRRGLGIVAVIKFEAQC